MTFQTKPYKSVSRSFPFQKNQPPTKRRHLIIDDCYPFPFSNYNFRYSADGLVRIGHSFILVHASYGWSVRFLIYWHWFGRYANSDVRRMNFSNDRLEVPWVCILHCILRFRLVDSFSSGVALMSCNIVKFFLILCYLWSCEWRYWTLWYLESIPLLDIWGYVFLLVDPVARSRPKSVRSADIFESDNRSEACIPKSKPSSHSCRIFSIISCHDAKSIYSPNNWLIFWLRSLVRVGFRRNRNEVSGMFCFAYGVEGWVWSLSFSVLGVEWYSSIRISLY